MLECPSNAVRAHGPLDALEQRDRDLSLTTGYALCPHLCFTNSTDYDDRSTMQDIRTCCNSPSSKQKLKMKFSHIVRYAPHEVEASIALARMATKTGQYEASVLAEAVAVMALLDLYASR